MIGKFVPGFLKVPIKNILQKIRAKGYEKNKLHITQKDFEDGLRRLGIVKGDILFIHSSLKSLGFIEGGPATIIQALMAVVGPEGGIMFPTFSMPMGTMHETLKNPEYVFDVDHSNSGVGAITNYFRKLDGVTRSLHPTHSVAVWGRACDGFTEGHYLAETPFGPDTPFGRLCKNGGKVLGIGVNLGPVTFYHIYEDYHLEFFPGVYLPEKFETKLISGANEYTSTTLAHSPEFHKNRIDKNPDIERYFRKYFSENGTWKAVPVKEGKIWVMPAQKALDTLDELYRKGITIYNAPVIEYPDF